MQFTIFGSGSLGTIVAGHLLKAGHRVRVVARGERASYLERRGLVVTGLAEFSEPCTVVKEVDTDRDNDVLIFAVKTYQMISALKATEKLRPRVVFSLANGLKKNELLKVQFPHSKVLGCMANFSGELLNDGTVEFSRNVALNLDGRNLDGRELSKIITESGIPTNPDNEIESTEWSKFTSWIPLFSLSLITRSPIGQFLSIKEFATEAYFIIREVASLAEKNNVSLHDGTVLPVLTLSKASLDRGVKELMAIGRNFLDCYPNHRISALQDLENRKRLEVHETLGHVIDMAKRHNVDLKFTPFIYRVIAGLDKLNQSCLLRSA